MEIRITCEGSRFVDFNELQDFQGDLKTIKESDLEKLKRSIQHYGFSFPIFVWGNKILDGHQRLRAIRDMVDSGFTISDIPIVEIQAVDKKEAAEKLLFLQSHYAKISDIGIDNFLEENKIDILDLSKDLNIYDFDMDEFLKMRAESEFEEESQEDDIKTKKRHLGDNLKKMRCILYSDDIAIFEKAIILTGLKNRGKALVKICKDFVENENV